MTPSSARLLRVDAHDDGINAWRMAHYAAGRATAGAVRGYSDYAERTGGFTTRREMPTLEAVLIVNLGEPIELVGGDGGAITLRAGEAFVAGTHLRPALSRSNGAQSGVHAFLPLASLRWLLGMPMPELLDRVVRLEALLGGAAHRLGEALLDAPDAETRVAMLDAALAARLAAMPALRRADLHALDAIATRGDLDLVDVAREIGWSRKHLASRIRDLVGVGPRSYRRLLRFQGALAAATRDPAPDWAGLAIDTGYCDQSHLIREFREFTGLTPRDYRGRLLADGGGIIEG